MVITPKNSKLDTVEKEWKANILPGLNSKLDN